MATDAQPRVVGVVGLLDDPDALRAAAATVRDAGYTRWDCHTPYPVHGLEAAMGLRHSPIPRVCIGAGLTGAALAMLMMWWMSAVDYPIVIGGKPLFSWQAFVPITFEFFVLFAAGSTFLAMIGFCRLGRWHSPLHDTGVMDQVTTTRFAIVLDADDPCFEAAAGRALLERVGCGDVRELIELPQEPALI